MRSSPSPPLLLALAPAAARRRSVSMGGSLGSNALLVIDGKPRNVAVGATVDGVQLVSVSRATTRSSRSTASASRCSSAARQVNLGGAAERRRAASRSCSPRDSGGHFVTSGTINGQHACASWSTPAPPRRDEPGRRRAHRPRLQERPARLTPAPPTASSPVYRVDARRRCASATSQVYNVDGVGAAGADAASSCSATASSTRFQMQRENDRLTLDKRN